MKLLICLASLHLVLCTCVAQQSHDSEDFDMAKLSHPKRTFSEAEKAYTVWNIGSQQ